MAGRSRRSGVARSEGFEPPNLLIRISAICDLRFLAFSQVTARTYCYLLPPETTCRYLFLGFLMDSGGPSDRDDGDGDWNR